MHARSNLIIISNEKERKRLTSRQQKTSSKKVFISEKSDNKPPSRVALRKPPSSQDCEATTSGICFPKSCAHNRKTHLTPSTEPGLQHAPSSVATKTRRYHSFSPFVHNYHRAPRAERIRPPCSKLSSPATAYSCTTSNKTRDCASWLTSINSKDKS